MAVNIKKEFGGNRNRKPDITSLVYGKVPPQAPELESAVLGVLLLEKDCLDVVLPIIPSPDCFYVDANQKIYAAILRLKDKQSPIDLLTVVAELSNSKELELVGGAYYLTKLTEPIVSGAHAEAHARIVMEKYMLREAIRISGSIIGDAYDDADPFELQERFITEMNAVYEGQSASGWVGISDVARQYVQEREERIAGRSGLVISTTFPYVDDLNVGFRGTELIIVAARPAVGKSAFVLPIITNAAKVNGPVGIVNLEMRNTQTFGRMVSHDSAVSYRDLEFGYNIGEDKLINHVGELSKLPIYFTTVNNLNINTIVAQVNWLVKKKGAKLIVIDYLQLIEPSQQRNREQEVSKISRALKLLAMAHDIPVIALSQLNRESANRTNKKPQLQDLRESGALEQDADIVFLLHRDWAVDITENANGGSTENEADLIVAKWRNGKTGDKKLHFDGPTMRFTEPPEVMPFKPPENPGAGIYRKPYPDDVPF